MKDLKLIEAMVISYYHQNKDNIDVESLEKILKDSLNIEINNVSLENNVIKVVYSKKEKILFEFRNDKIKIKRS